MRKTTVTREPMLIYKLIKKNSLKREGYWLITTRGIYKSYLRLKTYMQETPIAYATFRIYLCLLEQVRWIASIIEGRRTRINRKPKMVFPTKESDAKLKWHMTNRLGVQFKFTCKNSRAKDKDCFYDKRIFDELDSLF